MKNRNAQLAYKYARAFLNVYADQALVDEQLQSKRLTEFFHNHKQLHFFLKLPERFYNVQKIIIDRLADTLHLGQPLRSLFLLLLEHQRMYLIPEICKKVNELIDAKNGRIRCMIASWPTLNEKQKTTMRAFAQKKIGSGVIATYSEDPGLIAGVSLTTDSLQWEYSVRKKLATIERLFHDGD
jgi:ATP synthase F1 delta subunit